MQKCRFPSGALVWLPVSVATLSVLIALSGCGGSSTLAGTAPPPGGGNLPDPQLQQLGGIVEMTGLFTDFNPTNDDLTPPQTQQQSSCPQYNPISEGVYELDYGTGCQPYPGAPTFSGKIIIVQTSSGASFEISFENFSEGDGFVLNGNIAYALNPQNGLYNIAMDVTQSPATGAQSACSVRLQFEGSVVPNSSGGYTLNGSGLQTVTTGSNTVQHQISVNGVAIGEGCDFPISGSITVQQLAPTGSPMGEPLVINFGTGQCGKARVTFGSITTDVNLSEFDVPNPCEVSS